MIFFVLYPAENFNYNKLVKNICSEVFSWYQCLTIWYTGNFSVLVIPYLYHPYQRHNNDNIFMNRSC